MNIIQKAFSSSSKIIKKRTTRKKKFLKWDEIFRKLSGRFTFDPKHARETGIFQNQK